MQMMAAMDKAALARLAFWSLNMQAATGGKNSWPGFKYTAPEWQRMERLAEMVEGAAFVRFLAITAILFIVFAGAVVVCLFVPILIALYPNPADLQPLPFVLLLAATALLSLGIGLPLSMRLAARLSASKALRAKLVKEPGDAALAAKVSHQIIRMAVIMCGLLVPGVLLWIAFDIQGGPWITALKWLAIGLMGVSAVHAFATRSKG
jgi:hypothetical protein